MTKVAVNDKKVQREINNFVRCLLKKKIHPSKVILFGSHAKGTAKSYSDIDIAVVSPNFGHDEIEEMMTLAKIAGESTNRVEVVSFAEDYFTTSRLHPLIGEIKKYGKVVYST